MKSKWIYLLAVFPALILSAAAQQAQTHGGEPVVSPDGSHIVFLADRGGGADDVFVMAADGRDETQLTATKENEGNVQWSADGKQVLFSRFSAGTTRVYAVGLDGNGERELATVAGRGLIYSSDGRRCAFGAGNSWTQTQLMVAEADGSKAHQINDGTSIAWNLHWSPDGNQIAFTGKRAPGAALSIFVINADGSGLRELTHLPAEAGNAQWPVWSFDGRQIAFQVNQLKEKTSHIWVLNVATGEARKLGAHQTPYRDETPSWFPDGRHIAFQSDRSGRMEVWVMDADGENPRQLTH